MRISKGHGTGQIQPLLNLIQVLQVNTNPFPFTAFKKGRPFKFLDCKPTIPLSHWEKIKSVLSVAHKCEGESADLPAATTHQTCRISNAVNGKSFPNRTVSIIMRKHVGIVSLILNLRRLRFSERSKNSIARNP